MKKPFLVLLALAVLFGGCKSSINHQIKSRAHLGEKTSTAVALVVNDDLRKWQLNGINIGEGWINLLDARLAQYFDHTRIVDEYDLRETGYYDLWVFPHFYENGEEFQLQLIGKTSPYGKTVISTDVMGCALHKKVDIGETAVTALGTYGLYIPFIPAAIVKANRKTIANIETALVQSTDELVGKLQTEVKRNGFTSRGFAERRIPEASARIELRTDELEDTISGVQAGKGRYKKKRVYK